MTGAALVAEIFVVGFLISLVVSMVLAFKYKEIKELNSQYKEQLASRDRTIDRYTRVIAETETIEEVVYRVLKAQKEWPEGEAQPVQKSDEDDVNFQIRLQGFCLYMVSECKWTVNKAREVMGVPAYDSED